MQLTLSNEKANNGKNEYKHYSRVVGFVFRNLNHAKKYLEKKEKKGIFLNDEFEKMFSISGAFKINDLDLLKFPSNDFIKKKEGRYFIKKTNGLNVEYYLRGPRYITAIDPHLSVIQKLDILQGDINDAIDCIKEYRIENNQYLSISTVLDYLKNALITLFNSYIHKEKIGILKINDEKYQSNRSKLIELVESSVISYYFSLSDKFDSSQQLILIRLLTENIISEIASSIRSDFINFTFSSKSLVRPEASHPLVLLSYAINIFEKHRNIDFIIGLPSGSTEISSLLHQLDKFTRKNNECKLILIPISIHSIKDTGETSKSPSQINFNKISHLFQCKKDICNALIIDDNSASGRTLERIYNLISKQFHNIKITCSVAEADLIRISMNLKREKNDLTVCHPDVYKHSTNILPISKIISPKYDLKEVIERRQLYYYYLQRPKKNIIEKIIDEVIADSIEFRIEDKIHLFNTSNSIQTFKHGVFSNFYSVEFIYKGRKYFSVEQAYLRQKFDSEVLKKLTPDQKKELNNILKIKGIGGEKIDFSTAFYDYTLPAGVLKRWSSKLKEWGLEDKNWDSKRLYIMTELLLLKFANNDLMNNLLETGDLYLIEGNEWNDTFWGVCNNRGKNYLGRLLMNIRSKIINGEIDKQQLIKANSQ